MVRSWRVVVVVAVVMLLGGVVPGLAVASGGSPGGVVGGGSPAEGLGGASPMQSPFAVPGAATASASPLVWSGEAAKGSLGWSEAANWQGGVAPAFAGPVSLEFPRLTVSACAAPASGTCYVSKDDVARVTAETLWIDDGDEYELEGEPLTIGEGGIVAAPAAGTSGPAGDIFEMPVRLGGPQTWRISGREGGVSGENGVAIGEGVSGEGKALDVQLADGGLLYLEAESEVGPVSVEGSGEGAEGGVGLIGVLNERDGAPVTVRHAMLTGGGLVGPLTAEAAKIAPAGDLEAASVTLDAESEAALEIIEYRGKVLHSELLSKGAVSLGGAKLAVEAGPLYEGGPCPSLKEGESFTFVSATGEISGAFGDAKDGEEIAITLNKECPQRPQSLRISYQDSGTTQTVTGTVVEGAPALPPEPNIVTPAVTEVIPYKPIPYVPRPKPPAKPTAKVAPHVAPVPPSRVVLLSSAVQVRGRIASVKVRCKGGTSCGGRLVLKAPVRVAGKAHRRRLRKIASVRFVLVAGQSRLVKLKLDPYGRGLLRSRPKAAGALLAVVQSSPAPQRAFSRRVRLTVSPASRRHRRASGRGRILRQGWWLRRAGG